MESIQNINEVVDISDWRVDEEYRRYPEGARKKALLYSPIQSLYSFLKPNHPYLFKLSSHRYPEQFWMEIFAYQLSLKVGVLVPKYLVSLNGKEYLSGALSEWFFDPGQEIFKPGGDYFSAYIQDFDRKKGRQHNFETITEIFSELGKRYPDLNEVWLKSWAQIFFFDALIGNTDRHQDNWGIIINTKENKMRLAPAFDNGTSLGHEIRQEKFELASDKKWLENYIAKGYHHIRWKKNDAESIGHFLLLDKLMTKYPDTQPVMVACLLKVNFDEINNILNHLCSFEVPIRLTKERAAFMVKLLKARYDKIKPLLER